MRSFKECVSKKTVPKRYQNGTKTVSKRYQNGPHTLAQWFQVNRTNSSALKWEKLRAVLFV
nr:MAG TPA: hypothetical protein [Caudoviricetes sp.]